MKKVKLLNLKGHTIYVGIDVHLKSWKVTIRTEEFELKTFSQEPNIATLVNHLKQNYPDVKVKCVYEAGFSGFWLQRELNKLGIHPLFYGVELLTGIIFPLKYLLPLIANS